MLGAVSRRSAFACGLIALAIAGPAGASSERSARLLKGPYLQNVSPTAVSVLWETTSKTGGIIRLETPTGQRVIEVPVGERHEVEIDGLVPATRYRYVVESAGTRLGGEIATAPEVGSPVPVTFVVFGDTRSNPDSHRRVVERIRAEVPDFVIGTGDMVDEGGREHEWQTFFELEAELLRDNVFFPSIGNHDRQGRGRTADNYRTYFAVPENSPDPERYYAFTYGQNRFLVLDSNANSFALTDQTAWIERELQAARLDPRIAHVFVTMHHPPFSVSLHGGQRDLRERWTPLFEKYGVAAVFSGHDHVYSRGDKNGVRYFVSGGGGAPLYPRAPRPSAIDEAAIKRFERVNHYLRVHVFGDFVEVTAIRADGTAIETLAWGEAPAVAIPAETGASPQARVSAVPAVGAGRTAPGGGFGWLGRLGAAAVLAAILVLWRALRG
jgi:3',5'-cyclic AMP phosphodiesterase CpdA